MLGPMPALEGGQQLAPSWLMSSTGMREVKGLFCGRAIWLQGLEQS